MSRGCKRIPAAWAAAISFWLSESPGQISPFTRRGRMRISPRTRLSTADLRVEIPASDQLLRSSFSLGVSQCVQILRTVNVERKAWQIQHNTRQAGCLGGRPMRQKAVISKTKRNQVRRRPQRGVCTPPGSIRAEHRYPTRSGVEDLLEFVAFHQRNISGNHQS